MTGYKKCEETVFYFRATVNKRFIVLTPALNNSKQQFALTDIQNEAMLAQVLKSIV